jgi:hypothetical protein
MDSISDLILKLKDKPHFKIKKPDRQPFQLLALQIIKEFNIKGKDCGIVWRFCKMKSPQVIHKTISELKSEVNCKPIIYLKFLLKKCATG